MIPYAVGQSAIVDIGPIIDGLTDEIYDPPTLRLVVTNPRGDEAFNWAYGEGSEIVHDGVGRFHAEVPLSMLGAWKGRWIYEKGGVDPFVLFVEENTWRPTVNDIAGLLPSRSAGRFVGGIGAPEFADEPRVRQVIEWATGTVYVRLGGKNLPSKFYLAAQHLAVLRTALTLEPAAWPEQARPDKSAWEQWKLLYDEDLAGLIETIKQDAADGDSGDGGGESATAPVFSFPSAYCDHIEGSEIPTCLPADPNDRPLFWID